MPKRHKSSNKLLELGALALEGARTALITVSSGQYPRCTSAACDKFRGSLAVKSASRLRRHRYN